MIKGISEEKKEATAPCCLQNSMNVNIYYLQMEKKLGNTLRSLEKYEKILVILFFFFFFYHMYVISWPSYMYA